MIPLRIVYARSEFNLVTENADALGALEVVDVQQSPRKTYTMQVKEVGGAATSWQIVLEGSLDGLTYETILTHTKADIGTGKALFSGANFYPSLFYRARVVELTLGAATSVQIIHLGVS